MVEKSWLNQEFLLIGLTNFWFIMFIIALTAFSLLWYGIGYGVGRKWFSKAYWRWFWWTKLISGNYVFRNFARKRRAKKQNLYLTAKNKT